MTNNNIEEKHLNQTNKQYENCVSLGYYCGIASSLAKLGLRSHSGPFDWHISDFWAVIEQIESGFVEFMIKENLEIVDGNVKVFRDKKYGFYCNHDVENSFEAEYHLIYEKYMRRVEAFMEMIKRPTVFFRCIRDDKEVKYINSNWMHINELLKSFNSENQIIYVCRSGIEGITDKVTVFDLNIDRYSGNAYELRHVFDKCEELLYYCHSLLCIEKVKKNIEFDRNMNFQKLMAEYIINCVKENVDGIEASILEVLEADAGEGIFIWGAGNYGMTLSQYLRKRGIVIKGIIDNKEFGEVREGFQILTPDEIPDESKIFIAIAKKEANASIEKQIENMKLKVKVKRFQDLFNGNIDV